MTKFKKLFLFYVAMCYNKTKKRRRSNTYNINYTFRWIKQLKSFFSVCI